ncbi:MAG: P-II family nitrogen regulator [Clostridiaceae bacterium]|nr:P-II family nitrogen regulator [Clostridiaceae bacterium]
MSKQANELTIENQARILTLIFSEHQCHKCVRIAKERGIRGGIVTIGKGTVKSTILNLLGIKNQKKEIVSFLLNKAMAKEMLDYYTKELQLDEPGHGIAFISPVIVANQEISKEQIDLIDMQGMEEDCMYKKLTVIVERGMAEDVMEIARKAGVRGGTIMHGRGAGAEFTTKLFGVEIEPEKELVLILTPSELIDKVVNALYQELQLDKPGRGILFVEQIVEARGLFEPASNDEND